MYARLEVKEIGAGWGGRLFETDSWLHTKALNVEFGFAAYQSQNTRLTFSP
jgi:hypothetical protein